MTYRALRDWIPLDDLLGLSRGRRVAYVRMNLAAPRDGAAKPHMTLDDFAEAVGAKNRQAPMRWEKGATPRDYAMQIAALTPYPPEAFGAPGEAELLRQMYGHRLQRVEAEVAWLISQLGTAAAALGVELEPLVVPRSAQSEGGEE